MSPQESLSLVTSQQLFEHGSSLRAGDDAIGALNYRPGVCELIEQLGCPDAGDPLVTCHIGHSTVLISLNEPNSASLTSAGRDSLARTLAIQDVKSILKRASFVNCRLQLSKAALNRLPDVRVSLHGVLPKLVHRETHISICFSGRQR